MKSKFVDALIKEIELRRFEISNQPISSIYFGGGTPSLLTEIELGQIFEKLYQCFVIDADAEITLEANPDDLTREKIKSLQSTPINRISIGVQSFRDEDLQFMNRAHNADEAIRAIKTCQEEGFENLTVDLIYGTPNMDNDAWRANLKACFDLNIPHISSYALTVEEKTALHYQILTKKRKAISEEQSAEQFEILMEEMMLAGYEQYEISNFCKPEAYSRHNSAYWKKDYYLGFGPSAHSFVGKTRLWNVANNVKYIKEIGANKLPLEREVLSLSDRYNEYVMTSLRTKWGSSIAYIEKEFTKEYADYFVNEIALFVKQGYVVERLGVYYLELSGKLLADRIASELFKID